MALRNSDSVDLEYVVRRMVWVQRDHQWRGEWVWDAYDRDGDWDRTRKINRRWKDMQIAMPKDNHPAMGSRAGDIPQEVLLRMVLICRPGRLGMVGKSFLYQYRQHYIPGCDRMS